MTDEQWVQEQSWDDDSKRDYLALCEHHSRSSFGSILASFFYRERG